MKSNSPFDRVRDELSKTFGPRECTCHRDSDKGSHERCCGHEDGRDPNCPRHGDGSR